MAAVRIRLGAELRNRWRSWLALAAIVGLFAGAVMAAAAGARRTETSKGLAALVIANLVAVLPGRAAARVQPALVLRSE